MKILIGLERQFICHACPASCAYYTKDQNKPSAITRPCLRDPARSAYFKEA